MWFFAALLVAIFTAIKDVLSKSQLKKLDEYLIALITSGSAVIFFSIVLFLNGIPDINPRFWIVLFVDGIFYYTALIFYLKAIKASDLSITTPMLTFTPLFLLLTGNAILGEAPTLFSMLGVFLIVTGSYIMNIREKRNGYLAPFKALLSEKGPKYMLCTALLFSITSTLDKLGVQYSSTPMYLASINSLMAMMMMPMVWKNRKKNKIHSRKELLHLLPIGAANVISLAFHMKAITMTLVIYVISVKRLSALFCVLFGYWFFKEKGIKERSAGAILMITGVLLISFFKKSN